MPVFRTNHPYRSRRPDAQAGTTGPGGVRRANRHARLGSDSGPRATIDVEPTIPADRWQQLGRVGRLRVWSWYASAPAYLVGAAVAMIWWTRTSWMPLPVTAVILMSAFVWQCAALILLHRAEPDRGKRRMTFAAVSSVIAVMTDLALIVTVASSWWLYPDGPGTDVVPYIFAVLALLLLDDARKARVWRPFLAS